MLKGRLGSLAKGIRWAGLEQYMQGLSHAEVVRAAEAAAKTVILNQGTRVTAEDLHDALHQAHRWMNEG